MTHNVLPRLFAKFASEAAENVGTVSQLDEKYAQLSREMEARSAAINKEKNQFIRKFTKQCDDYQAMADALRDRTIKLDPAMILLAIGLGEPPLQQQPLPEPEPTIPDWIRQPTSTI